MVNNALNTSCRGWFCRQRLNRPRQNIIFSKNPTIPITQKEATQMRQFRRQIRCKKWVNSRQNQGCSKAGEPPEVTDTLVLSSVERPNVTPTTPSQPPRLGETRRFRTRIFQSVRTKSHWPRAARSFILKCCRHSFPPRAGFREQRLPDFVTPSHCARADASDCFSFTTATATAFVDCCVVHASTPLATARTSSAAK